MTAAYRRAGLTVTAGDEVVASAYLAALTVALLDWADSRGQRPLENATAAAFDTLRGLAQRPVSDGAPAFPYPPGGSLVRGDIAVTAGILPSFPR